MLLDEKTLNKYENEPKKITSSLIYARSDYYGDYFQKSANEHYNTASKYATRLLEKSIGKSVKLISNKLKSHPSYGKNKSFTKSIDSYVLDINNKLEDNYNRGSFYNEDGKVAYIGRTSWYDYAKSFRNRFIREVWYSKILDGYGLTNYIIRLNGIYYYVSEEGYYYASLRVFVTSEDIFKKNFYLVKLDKFDLKHYDLTPLEELRLSDKDL